MAQQRVQRRLAAILAADVVGYSRLMGEDEEGTLARLKALRREVFDPETKRHGGRVFKTTGDGALVEFPSAVNAVRCAIDLQQKMAGRGAHVPDDRRIEFRIGINQTGMNGHAFDRCSIVLPFSVVMRSRLGNPG